MTFNLTSSRMFAATRFAHCFPWGIARFVQFFCFMFGGTGLILALAHIGYTSLAPDNPIPILHLVQGIPVRSGFGFALIFLPLAISWSFFTLFFKTAYTRPSVHLTDHAKPEFNLADSMTQEAIEIIALTILKTKDNPEDEAAIHRAFIDIFLAHPTLAEFLTRAGIDSKKSPSGAHVHAGALCVPFILRTEVPHRVLTILNEAFHAAIVSGMHFITPELLFTALIVRDFDLQAELARINMNIQDLKHLAEWFYDRDAERRYQKEFWRIENLVHSAPVGKNWIYGFTPTLSAYSVELSETVPYKNRKRIVGRMEEIERIERTLVASNRNNVLLVGPTGVGKNTIIEEIVKRAARGLSLPGLNYKRIFELNLSLFLSNFNTREHMQNALMRLLNEAEHAGNILLVVSDVQSILGSKGDGLGAVDVSEILMPYLSTGRLQMLATTDPESFHATIEHSSFMRAATRVDITEPSLDDTRTITEELLPQIEGRFGVWFTYRAIETVIQDSDRYIQDTPLPEKAINLLNESGAVARAGSLTVVTEDVIHDVITKQYKIPVALGGEQERRALRELETRMHEQVVSQHEAIKLIADTLRRVRIGMAKRGKPLGSFLFLGPTGVGKTETAKTLAAVYYGSAGRMIRFDMSEFQTESSVDRFIGSVEQQTPGQFTSAVRDQPFSLILLDEIEKAYPPLLNLFLQVLDEGHITDAFGRKVSLEQTIIIATSNAGSELIRQMVQQNLDPALQQTKLIDELLKLNLFRPEFLNRFDAIVAYHPLTREELAEVALLQLDALQKRLKNNGYLFQPTPELAHAIATIGYDPEFGARPMARAIQNTVETLISNGILDGTIQKGMRFTLSHTKILEMGGKQEQI